MLRPTRAVEPWGGGIKTLSPFKRFDIKYEKISDSNSVVVTKIKFAPQILV